MARVQLQRVLSATLHFVVIQKQSQTAPPETGGPSVAFHRICLVSSRSSLVPLRPSTHPTAARSRLSTSQFPLLLTRRDVLLMKMKGLLIFSLPARVGRLLSSILLSFHRGSLPSDITVTIFPDVLTARMENTHTTCRVPLPALCSPSLPPLLAAVILLSVYRTGLPGMRQRALRKINSD